MDTFHLLLFISNRIDQSQKAELLKLSMESATLLGCLSGEMSKRRRLAMKPVLNKEVAGICSEAAPAGELLFGDNLPERIKATKSTASMLKSVGTSSYRGRRYSPYGNQNLNFRAPSQRGGGYNRPYRGQGMNRSNTSMLSRRQNYQQQNYQQANYQQK